MELPPESGLASRRGSIGRAPPLQFTIALNLYFYVRQQVP